VVDELADAAPGQHDPCLALVSAWGCRPSRPVQVRLVLSMKRVRIMGWVWLGLLSIVVLLVVLGYLAMLLAQGKIGQPPGERSEPRRSARQILEDRYVRGEIDTEEYRCRRAELP
jgi:putative membrane protein